MCDFDVIGVSSIFNGIHSTDTLVRMLSTYDLSCEENVTDGSGTVLGCIPEAELLKPQKIGQFSDEFVKIKDTQSHYGVSGSMSSVVLFIVYYESRIRELKTRPTYECRCDEKLKLRNLHTSYTLGFSGNWNT